MAEPKKEKEKKPEPKASPRALVTGRADAPPAESFLGQLLTALIAGQPRLPPSPLPSPFTHTGDPAVDRAFQTLQLQDPALAARIRAIRLRRLEPDILGKVYTYFAPSDIELDPAQNEAWGTETHYPAFDRNPFHETLRHEAQHVAQNQGQPVVKGVEKDAYEIASDYETRLGQAPVFGPPAPAPPAWSDPIFRTRRGTR